MPFVALLVLVIALAGCKVDSLNPISAAADAHPDAALYGAWLHREKGELTYVHIGPEFSLNAGGAAENADRRTRIVLIDHKASGLSDEAYVAHVSRIGKRRFLNVLQLEDGKPAGFIFVRYALVGRNTLRFWMLDEEALKTAIRAGRIKGTIRGQGLTSETAITAESAEIENFLELEGGKLFTKPIVLRRAPQH